MYGFTYHRPTTVRQAASLLAKYYEAKLLAGGHSLIPVMKLRLAKPPDIVDSRAVEGLSGIELKGRSIVIGAMTKHGEVANLRSSRMPCRRSPRCRARSAIRTVRHRRHDRRLARQQRSERRLPGRLPRPRRHHHHQQAPHRGRRFLHRACSRPRSSRTRSSPRCSSRSPRRRPTRSSSIRPRALRWSACSCRSAAPDIRVAVTGAGSNGVFRVHELRGGAEEAVRREVAGRHDHPGGRHEQRHPRRRRNTARIWSASWRAGRWPTPTAGG